jgi:hypothetical protein
MGKKGGKTKSQGIGVGKVRNGPKGGARRINKGKEIL